MEIKQNQTFFYGTWTNLTHISLTKNSKIFQWLSKPKFLGFMTEVNPNNGIETWSFIIGTFQSHCKGEHNQDSRAGPHQIPSWIFQHSLHFHNY